VGAVAVAYGTLFAAATNGTLYALDRQSGALRWRGLTDSPITDSPSIAAGVVWVGTQDGHLDAFRAHGCGNATCQPLASFEISQGEPLYASPAIANNTIYIASYDRRLVALSTG
jgi:outer membrane protein assembly factor BamB